MRRARRKAANKEKVFGCDLMEHLAATNQDVPLVLRSCSEFVESHGIVDGIYRLSGVSSNIQKLRGEFESDTGPELNRELYLQDIHCVSSLCKAYFRELPNPLLTYRLYDKFAEAVALQLEDERLVKIRDVLKELPPPHYRTLEFLMRHLVHVASFSSETNMHSRNLAIVWAPNLLRSKEIEVCGFNGTAAFMEVRVQSIVVEFILTHVPQLFPEPGASSERRKSLPSPCFLTNQEEAFFKQPTMNIGNLSPGDGPLPIRPYHSIIEGPDKRKGSLKGRRWMSIFNIGGRFHETRRRHKTSTKEKDHPTLRGARSMDSLSSPSPRSDPHPSPRPPSSHLSPLAVAQPQPQPQPPAVSEPPAPTSPRIVSEYAVTYRRGTGQVTTGTQGTYTALDPEGPTSNDAVQTRSPGLTAKAGRRIAVHITGPTMVTVPLHITSNLALGVLQGGGGDRIIHRGSNKEVKEMKEVRSERKGSEVEKREAADEQGSKRKSVLEVFRAPTETEEVGEGPCELEVGEGPCELEVGEGPCELEVGEGPCELEVGEGPCELEVGEGPCEREVEDTRPSNSEASNSEIQRKHRSREEEAMDVEKETGPDPEPDPGPDPGTEDYVFDPEDMSPEADDLNLSGYVQHNFDFLDQMDCSLMDRSCRIQEFSVEPPGNYEEEYETMDHPPTPPATPTLDAISPSRLLTADIHQRHTKSLSLPFMSSPLPEPDESESGSESASDVSADYEEEEEEEEEEDMFMQSLPSDFFLNDLTNTETQLGDNLTVYVSSMKLIEGEVSEEHALESEESDEEESEIAGESCQTKESADKDIETEAVCVLHEDECMDGKQAEVEEQNTDLVVDQDLEREEDTGGDDIQAVLSQTCVVEMEEDWQCAGSETRNDSLDGSDGLESCELEVDTEEEKTTEDDLHKDTGSADKSPEPAGGSVVEVRPDDEGSDEDHILHRQMNTIDTEEKCVSHNPLQEDQKEITGNHFDSTQKENRHGNGQIVPPEFDGNGIDVDNLQGQLDEEEVFEETAKGESIDDIWDELEDVVCEVIEDLETQEPNVEKSTDIEEKTWNVLDSDVNKVENQVQKDRFETDIKLKDGHYYLNVANAKCAVEKPSQKPPTEAKPEHLQCTEIQQCPGVGSKVVTSKLPKVYCAKAVPIVPPKSQHCKLTALTLRQQQQRAPEDQRLEAEELNANWWKDRDESIRQSPQSMCFDEAVAIATLRRGKGRESDRDRAHTAKSEEK
ncbi:unnamed protein product [Knipowitschia caucasica]